MTMQFLKIYVLSFLTCATAFGQSGGLEDYGGSDPIANEALESATPTDNVNELGNGSNISDDVGGGDYSLGGGNYGDGDYSGNPLDEDPSDFNIDDNYGGDSLFGDESSSGGIPGLDDGESVKAAPSALGNGAAAELDEVNTAPIPAAAPLTNTQYGNQTQELNPIVTGSNPLPNVEAESLMQEIEQTNTISNYPAPQNPVNQYTNQPADINAMSNSPDPAELQAVSEITEGDRDLIVQDEAEGPLALPLPMPNQYSGAPPVPGTLRQMAEGEAPELYVVEHGDTLFDICDQLLDEPTYWPKLWAMNPAIKNPHFIYPGVSLKFYPGDDDSPPYLQVVAEEDIIPIDKGDLDESELIAEIITLPKDTFELVPIEVIGPESVQDELSINGFEAIGASYSGSDVYVRVPMFLFAAEKEAVGYAIGGRNGELTAIDGRSLLVERIGELAAGSTYTVLRPHGIVENSETGEDVGFKYSFIANIVIKGNVDDDVMIGEIKDTRLSVMKNDIIVQYISTNRMVPFGDEVGGLASIDASIVGFEYDGQIIGGRGQMAMIDKGSGDGVSVGMYVPIYSSPSMGAAFSDLSLPNDYRKVGVIRIIDATDAGAIGYIVRNSNELKVGDRTGKG